MFTAALFIIAKKEKQSRCGGQTSFDTVIQWNTLSNKKKQTTDTCDTDAVGKKSDAKSANYITEFIASPPTAQPTHCGIK